MDSNIFKGKWHQLKGSVKEKWGKLTNDDVDQVDGSFERLVGRVQERYGYMKERAEQEVNDFLRRHETPHPGSAPPAL